MEDTNYLDLIILKKIDASSSVEKFGTMINTSFFETANLLGTLKVKGLLDFQTSIGGQSPVALAGEGKEFLEHASRKAGEEIDQLDRAILSLLAGGVRDLGALTSAINIRPKDLAFHLNKLKVSDYVDYEVRSSKVSLSLTEKGFMLAGGARGAVGLHPAEAAVPAQAYGQIQTTEPAAPKSNPQERATAPALATSAQKSPAMPHSPKSEGGGFWSSLFGGKAEEKKQAANEDIAEILEGEAKQQTPEKSFPIQQPKPSAPPSETIGRAPPWVKQAKPSAPSSPWQASNTKQQSQAAPSAQPSPSKAGQAPSSQQGAPPKQTTLESAGTQQPSKPSRAPSKEDMQSARFISKLDFYVQNYWIYGAMLIGLAVLLAFAALTALLPKVI